MIYIVGNEEKSNGINGKEGFCCVLIMIIIRFCRKKQREKRRERSERCENKERKAMDERVEERKRDRWNERRRITRSGTRKRYAMPFYVLLRDVVNYSNVLPRQVTDYTDLGAPPHFFFDDASSAATPGMHTRRGLTF